MLIWSAIENRLKVSDVGLVAKIATNENQQHLLIALVRSVYFDTAPITLRHQFDLYAPRCLGCLGCLVSFSLYIRRMHISRMLLLQRTDYRCCQVDVTPTVL